MLFYRIVKQGEGGGGETVEYELDREKGRTTLALRRCLSCCCQPCLRGGSDPGDAKTGVHAPWMTGAGRSGVIIF